MDAGNTPDTMANEDGEAWNHDCRKGTYALIYKTGVSLKKIRYQGETNYRNVPNPSWPKPI